MRSSLVDGFKPVLLREIDNQAMPTLSRDVQIVFGDQGSGEPALLLLPGWCINREIFNSLMERCSRRRRVMTLDWRGHGESQRPRADYTSRDLALDALALVETSSIAQIVPVAMSHAGWIALEMVQELGRRIPGLIFVDWMMSGVKPAFSKALDEMQSVSKWRDTVTALTAHWLGGLDNPIVTHFVRDHIGFQDFDSWARAAREISGAYRQHGSPLQALLKMNPPRPVLHLYSQNCDPEDQQAQERFSAEHSWYQSRKLEARSHLPMLEVPDVLAREIESFAAALPG